MRVGRGGRTPAIIGVGGGAATAALGVAALTHGERTIQFAHGRNRLTPVFSGTDPDHLYPSFVFRMLTLRAEMFEGLESAIQGLARDLELLNRSLVSSLAPH